VDYLNVQSIVGGAVPDPQTVSLATLLQPTMGWTARATITSGGNWLSVSPISGNGSAKLTVSATPGNLPVGNYVGTVTIAAPLAANSPVSFDVHLFVRLPGPSLVLNPTTLSFSSVAGVAPAPLSLAIANQNGGAINWSIQTGTRSGGNWLQVTPGSGSGKATVQVSASASNLDPGTYAGSITVSAPFMPNSPQTIPVTLNVSPPPAVSAAPSTLSFVMPTDSPEPAAQSIALSSGLNWKASAKTTSGVNWLTVDPAGGTGDGAVRVSVHPASLAEGKYTGAIEIAAADRAGSRFTVPVVLTVGLPIELAPDDIASAATRTPVQAIAPNELLSLSGKNFTFACGAAGRPCLKVLGSPLPAQLGDTRVTFNGIAAPLVSVMPNRIDLVAPSGLSGLTATVVVHRGDASSPPVTLPLAEQNIGIFTGLKTGAGAAKMEHVDGRPVTRTAPLEPGEVAILYLTGLGETAAAPLHVYFDEIEGRILAAESQASSPGLYKMRIQVPGFLTRRYPIVKVQSSTSTSNEVSAGGPSVMDISPNSAATGADLAVKIRGLNLPPNAALQIGGENIPARAISDDSIEAIAATIPGRLLHAGTVSLTVVDPAAPAEAPSNPVWLTVTQ
jgi:uncharacterized protein (TIGR03437 family)